MAAPGDVLFSKGSEEDHDDIWDDSELIKAYDEAVKQVKQSIGENSASVNETANTSTKKQKNVRKSKAQKRKRSKVKNRSPANNFNEWVIGRHCGAIYSEDGLIYEAVIQSINTSARTCIVRFLGYGNEEEIDLDDLYESTLTTQELKRLEMDFQNDDFPEFDKFSASDSDVSSSAPSSISSRGKGKFRSNHGQRTHTGSMPSVFGSMPPPTQPGGMPGFMPPQMFASGTFPSGSNIPVIPDIPPPPPFDEDLIEGDSQALYSMLIAWYMSGYHTGFYQGLKQGKNLKKKNPKNNSSHKESKDG